MNRFFLVRDYDLPNAKEMATMGPHSFIELSSHGPHGEDWNVVCLEQQGWNGRPTWIAFPSLLSRKTLAESDVPEETLKDLGLTGAETAIEAAELFGIIMPQMAP